MNYRLIFLAVCWSFASCGPTAKEADPGDEIIEPEAGVRDAATTPAPLVFGETWDEWKSWEAPKKIIKMTPYFKSGYDYEGLPVYVIQFGKWNYRALARLNSDEKIDFLKRYEQSILIPQTKGAANHNAGIVWIMDNDGFSLGNYASRNALELALRAFISLTRINDVLQYGYFINTNFTAETFLNIARPFLGTLPEKFEIHGGRRQKWRPALLRKIPSSQLPPEYGGAKDWKPAPWNK